MPDSSPHGQGLREELEGDLELLVTMDTVDTLVHTAVLLDMHLSDYVVQLHPLSFKLNVC